jgi:hypothetical protein
MDNQQLLAHLMGDNDLIELTDELIDQIIKDKLWSTAESLREMRDMGFMWHPIRKSCMTPAELF